MDVLRLACLGMTFLAGSFVASSLTAAPFVWGAPRPLAERISDSRAAVIAVPAGDAVADGWRVEHCLHDVTGAVERGDVIHPTPAPSRKYAAALLLARRDHVLEPVPLSVPARDYLEKLPATNEPIEQRLRHACSHLEAADPLIAQDAFTVLGRFGVAELRRHRSLLPVESLRALVRSPDTPADRVGLYAYLLGLLGNQEDAALIRRRLDAPVDGLATEIPGLIAGYLLLAGGEGLAELEGNVLLAGRRSPLFVAAFYESLQTLEREHPELFSPERLRQTARCGLNRTDAADLAIGYLAGRRAWRALPEVCEALEASDPDSDRRRAVRIAAVRFLMECRRDTAAAPALRSQAADLLQQLAQADGDLVRRAERIAGGPPVRN